MAKEGNPWTIKKKKSQLRANDSESRIFSLQHQQSTLSGVLNPSSPLFQRCERVANLNKTRGITSRLSVPETPTEHAGTNEQLVQINPTSLESTEKFRFTQADNLAHTSIFMLVMFASQCTASALSTAGGRKGQKSREKSHKQSPRKILC